MSIARAADLAFKLALRLVGVRQSRLELADVVDQLPEDGALFPLFHQDGSVGVMCLDAASTISFVEQQTLGRLIARDGPPRALTRTDKALSRPFIDEFLQLFDDSLKDAPTAYWTRGYRADEPVPSRHLMTLQLDASEFRGFEMMVQLGEIQDSCVVRMFLPIKERQIEPRLKKGKTDLDPEQRDRPKLRNAALGAHIEMDAIMCKMTMPLHELSSLKPGQILPLPQNATQHAKLQDKIGEVSMPVNLGQLHGMRAVRVVRQTGGAVPSLHANPKPDRQRLNPMSPEPEPQASSAQQKEMPDTVSMHEPQQDDPAHEADELDVLLSKSKT